MPLLDIRNLTIEIKTGEGWVKAVDRISITLAEGEIRGLVEISMELPDEMPHYIRK